MHFFSSDLSHQLITEGNAVADKLQAHFMTSSSTSQQKTAFYTPFFKEVWERKPQIEKAFSLEDSDYSIGSRTPVPPPVPSRQESYHIRSRSLEDGGDSEGLYERLPVEGGHGPDDGSISPTGFIDGPPLSPSDDSELYASVFNQENGEHLVKPSQIKNRRSLQAGWVENRLYGREWPENEMYHTYQSDRQKMPPPTKPKPRKPKPKKIDLKQYGHLTDAIGRINLTSHKSGATLPKVGLMHAPLATPESMDLGNEYAQVKDAVHLFSAERKEYEYTVVHNALPDSKPHRIKSLNRRHGNRDAYERGSDSESEWSSLERRQREVYTKANRKPTPHKKTRKKRGIPAAPPRIPSFEGPPPPLPPFPEGQRIVTAQSLDPLDKAKLKLEQSLTSLPPQEDDSSYEIASPRDGTSTTRGKSENDKTSKKKDSERKTGDLTEMIRN